MTDLELWSAAAARVTAEYALLPALLREQVVRLAREIGERKQQSIALASAGDYCARCRGRCCAFGKHHFSVVDLIGFLVADRELFTPDFGNPLCPYHTGRGCVMEPALRPFTCTIFICEHVDDCLDDDAKFRLAAIEESLRRLYTQMEQLLGNRFENGLLITYERGLASGGSIFGYRSAALP